MKVFKRLILILSVAVMLGGTALASGSSERLFPPSSVTGSQYPPAVTVDDNGNVAMAGTVEHSPGGDDWSIIYYEKGDEVPSQSTQDFTDCDTARGVAEHDSKVIVVGSQGTNSSGKDWKIAEIAPQSGELVWQDSWDNNGHDDEAMAVAMSKATAVVAGYTSDGTRTSVRMAAYDAKSGAKIWGKTLTRPTNDLARFVEVDGDQMAVVGGSRTNSTQSSWLLIGVKVPDGEVLWEKAGPDLPTGKMLGMAVSQDGRVAAVGYSYNGTEHRWTVVLLSPEGNLLWKRTLNTASEAKGVTFDNQGRVVVAGFSIDSSRRNVKVVWYDASGNEELAKSYDGGNNDEAMAVAADLSGNVVVTGYTYNGSDRDILVLCYDSKGEILWSDTIGGEETNETGYRVVVSKTGESTVVGVAQSVGGYEWKVIRYKGHVLSHTLQKAEVRALELKEDPDVATGDYLGLGSVVNNGTQLKVAVSLPLYIADNGNPVEVNLYFAIAFGGYLYILQQDSSFSTETLEPWKKGVKAPLKADILPAFSVVNPITGDLLLPAGDYVFYLLVVPSTVKDDLSNLKADGLWELTYAILKLGE